MLLSVTEAAKAVGCARSTIYDKINAGELSRGSGGKIDTAELLRVFGELKGHDTTTEPTRQTTTEDPDTLAADLLDIVRSKDSELTELRRELSDTQSRLNEHRDNARLLEDKSREWEQALSERQAEIEQARRDASELAEQLKQESEQRAKAEALATALKGRGLIDRLFNRKPDVVL